jgi:hypothetical protein
VTAPMNFIPSRLNTIGAVLLASAVGLAPMCNLDNVTTNPPAICELLSLER